MARRLPLIRRVGIWLGLLLTMVVLSVLLWPSNPSANMRSLAGPRLVEVVHNGQDIGVKEIFLPGFLQGHGVPNESHIRARWNVRLPPNAGPWAVWIERPEYASRATWDGVVVGQTGDVDGTARSERPLFAILPATPDVQDHTLELEIVGDFGRGGVVGRMLHGPVHEMNHAIVATQSQRMALVVILASLAIIQLIIASRRRWRPANAFFGLFCLCAAAYIFFGSDTSMVGIEDAVFAVRIRRVSTAWIGPTAVAFACSFRSIRPPRWMTWILGFACITSLSSLVWPMDYMPVLENALDASLVVCAVLFLVVVLPMSVQHRHGGTLLAAATTLPLVYGAMTEVLVTHGFGMGGSHLFPTLITFSVGATAALMVRDIELSERHEHLVQRSVDAMITIDPKGVLTDANPAAIALFDSALLGSHVLDWVAQDDWPLVRAHYLPSPHRPDRAEFRFKDNTDLVIESVGTSLERGNMLLVLRDVSRRRKLDQGLLQAARMETVAVLVGGIAHDFNNMLGTLLAHVGFLQMYASKQEKIRKRLQRMETTIERASLLTRRLLALSGGATASLSSMDLHEVMKSAVELVEPTISDQISLIIDVPEGLPHVAGSPTDLEHVLVNLLVNARDAIAGQGNIRFAARTFETEAGLEGVLLVVEDDGIGVPSDLREKIFTPFFSTKGPKRGTGLGLAVATQIVREHHGRIWVEDRQEGGSQFCIALHHADALYEENAPLPDGRSVLLVEDEDVLRTMYGTALRNAGYKVKTRANGESGAEYLQSHRPDILVTDVIMPGMSGIELARLCRALHPNTPVLLVSGFIPDNVLEQDEPMMHRLDKPVRASRLVAVAGRIRRAAERAERGHDDITESIVNFPSLDTVTLQSAGWHITP